MIREVIYIHKPRRKKGKIKLVFLIGDCGGCDNCSLVSNVPPPKACEVCEKFLRTFLATGEKLKNDDRVVMKKYRIR